MNLKSILTSPLAKGLLAAAFAGGAAAAGASITDPTHVDLHHLGGVFLTGAVAGVLLYLKNPPTKPWDGVDRRDDASAKKP